MKKTTAKSPTKIKEDLGNAVQQIRSVQKFLKGTSNESVDDTDAHRERI
jgi:hypothetical protein